MKSLIQIIILGVFVSFWVACIKPVDPKDDSVDPKTLDIVDQLNLQAISVKEESITIGWDKSQLVDLDTFGYYLITARGFKRDGSSILPNPIRFTNPDSTSYSFAGLSNNQRYNFQVASFNELGVQKGEDGISIITKAKELRYDVKGSLEFPQDEEIIDFSVPIASAPVLIATSKAIYQLDRYLEEEPIVRIQSNQIKQVLGITNYIIYATPDSVVSTNLTFGTVFSNKIVNVTEIKTTEDEQTIFLITPDSIIAVTPALQPIPNFTTINLQGNQITDLINSPVNSSNYYISTRNGVYRFDQSNPTPSTTTVAAQGDAYYKTIAENPQNGELYLGRNIYKNDRGSIATFNTTNNQIITVQAFSDVTQNAGGLSIEYIHIDQEGVSSALINNTIYIYLDNTMYEVPEIANTSMGYSNNMHIQNDLDYYVSGKNKISVFTWFLSQ